MKLTLPLPPTANKYWRNVLIRGRAVTLLSKDARAYKKAAELAGLAHRVTPLDGEVSVRATVYMARLGADLDNRIKPTLDALRGIAFGDDRQVAHLEFTKALDRGNPRVEIVVEAVMEAAKVA